MDFAPAVVGSHPLSHPLTQAEGVVLVPTEGHTSGHLSLIVREADHAVFLAGDTSHSQRLMLEEVVDGVAPDEQVSRQTLRRIHAYKRKRQTNLQLVWRGRDGGESNTVPSVHGRSLPFRTPARERIGAAVLFTIVQDRSPT